jgi:hypothetical protein
MMGFDARAFLNKRSLVMPTTRSCIDIEKLQFKLRLRHQRRGRSIVHIHALRHIVSHTQS